MLSSLQFRHLFCTGPLMQSLAHLLKTLHSQAMLQATSIVFVKMYFSKSQTVSPITGRPSPTPKPLSLPPQLFQLPFLVGGGPLSSHPPQFPDLPFTLRRANALRYSAPTVNIPQLSATISTQADIQDATVPHLPANNNRRRRQSPVRNFSLPTYHPEQPYTMSRYYATALTSEDRIALAQGIKNHNLKRWTPKNLILHEEARKDLMPAHTYIGPDDQVCIIPVIIVTDGPNSRTHAKQLSQKLHTQRSSSAPSLPPPDGPIARARARAHSRTASSGSYFAQNHHGKPTPRPSGPYKYASISQCRVRSPLANEVNSYKP